MPVPANIHAVPTGDACGSTRWSLRDDARIDPPAQFKFCADRTHDRVLPVETEVRPQLENGFDPRAVRADQVLHAKTPQFLGRPRERLGFRCKQMQSTDQRMHPLGSDHCPRVVDRVHHPRGPKRDREIVVPRQIAAYLSREETDASLVRIGGALGGRDHSTIIHGCTKIEREMSYDAELRREVALLREALLRLGRGVASTN